MDHEVNVTRRAWPIERKAVTTEVLATPTYRSRVTPWTHTGRLWLTFMLVLAMEMAAIAVVAAAAQAGSFSEGFPNSVLMKGGEWACHVSRHPLAPLVPTNIVLLGDVPIVAKTYAAVGVGASGR